MSGPNMPLMLPPYLQSFVESFNTGDSHRVVPHFAEDAVLDLGGGQLARGEQEIRRALGNFVSLGIPLRLELVYLIETSDTACAVMDWVLMGTSKNGQFVNLSNRSLHVWTRGPGGDWQIKIDKPFSELK